MCAVSLHAISINEFFEKTVVHAVLLQEFRSCSWQVLTLPAYLRGYCGNKIVPLCSRETLITQPSVAQQRVGNSPRLFDKSIILPSKLKNSYSITFSSCMVIFQSKVCLQQICIPGHRLHITNRRIQLQCSSRTFQACKLLLPLLLRLLPAVISCRNDNIL